jgi:hypothetical protein
MMRLGRHGVCWFGLGHVPFSCARFNGKPFGRKREKSEEISNCSAFCCISKFDTTCAADAPGFATPQAAQNRDAATA